MSIDATPAPRPAWAPGVDDGPPDDTPSPEPWDDDWDEWIGTRPPVWAWDLAGLAPRDVPELLDGADLDHVDDAALVEVVAAWQRVAAWATAQSALAAGALAERESMNPEWPDVAGDVSQPCVAADEIAMRLAWSRPVARRLVREGTAFRRSLAWTGDALADGALCPAKARVMVDALADQSLDVALAVQDDVLGDAPGLTPGQLSRRLQDAVLRTDPGGARARREAARRGRRLDRPRPLPDGTAGIWAVVDAADAVRIDNGVDVLARAARNGGDPRTLDQLRADVLVDLVLGRLCPGPSDPGRVGADDPADATAGTTGARQDRSAAGDASAEAGGTVAASTSSSTVAAGPAGAGADEACPPAVTLTGLPQRAVIHVTVPLSTLLGSSEEPGRLDGYGPVDADTARALALGGPWQRLVTDPLSGAVLDVGRRRYRPPAALADHVRHRDRTCVAPTCSTSAHACDLDHTVPFDAGGPTADGNLGPACRRDHLIKTHAGFHLEQPVPGTFRWRTPTGQVYDVTPGEDRARQHHAPRPPWWDDGTPPPF